MRKAFTPAPPPPKKELHTCVHCGHAFAGKICNECGEKVFRPEQLSVKAFVHQAVDVFTHFENKVLKTIWLTLSRPGFVVAENLRGVRVPYAKPVQLFIIVNLLFYLGVGYINRTDYIPNANDNWFNSISARPGLGWMAPVDTMLRRGVDSLRARKLRSYEVERSLGAPDTALAGDTLLALARGSEKARKSLFLHAYKQKVPIFSKALIFVLIPVMALLFYAFFGRRLRYYGAALILATHFLCFNLLFYLLLQAVNFLPLKWLGSEAWSRLPSKGVAVLLYNEALAPVSTAVFGLFRGFEAMHVIAWSIWLFLAFRRMFKLYWLHNLVVSYLLARLFFILIFTFYKDGVIAVTVGSV